MDCLYCGKKEIADEWLYCGECGVNLKEYQKAHEFIEKGMEFEKQLEYEKASEEYRKAMELNIPQDKILIHLERVTAKEQEIIDTTEKAEELLKSKKWKLAIKTYEKVLRLSPSSLGEVEHKLDKARHMVAQARKRKLLWAICIIIIAGAVTGGWWRYTRTPEQVAQRTLRHAIISPDIQEKLAAIEAAGKLKDKTLLPFLKDALRDPQAVIRTYAVRALGQIKDSSAIPLLKECLSDKSWEVRIEAAHSLGLFGDSTGIKVLREAIRLRE